MPTKTVKQLKAEMRADTQAFQESVLAIRRKGEKALPEWLTEREEHFHLMLERINDVGKSSMWVEAQYQMYIQPIKDAFDIVGYTWSPGFRVIRVSFVNC